MKKNIITVVVFLMLGMSLVGCQPKTQFSNRHDSKYSQTSDKSKNKKGKKRIVKKATKASSESGTQATHRMKYTAKIAQSAATQQQKKTSNAYKVKTEGSGDDTVVFTMNLTDDMDNTDKLALKVALVKVLATSIEAARTAQPNVKLQLVAKNPKGQVLINEPITEAEIQTQTQN